MNKFKQFLTMPKPVMLTGIILFILLIPQTIPGSSLVASFSAHLSRKTDLSISPAPQLKGIIDNANNETNGTVTLSGDNEIAAIASACKNDFEKQTGIKLNVRATSNYEGLVESANGNADITMYSGTAPISWETVPTDARDLEDNGRCYSSVLVSGDIGSETAVMGTSSFFLPEQSRGGVRVRVWSRLVDVQNKYGNGLLVWVGGTKFEVTCIDPRNSQNGYAFDINSTDPGPFSGKPTLIRPVVYDILSFFDIPTSTIETCANNFLVDSITLNQPRGYDNILEFSQGLWDEIPDSVIDLPQAIPYYDADSRVQNANNNSSGAEAMFYFNWNLPADQQGIQVVSSGQVRYHVCVPGGIPWWVWSGKAQENIVINP